MGLKGGLKSGSVIFFMDVPFVAAHQTSSSLLVFFGPDGLHGLDDLPVEVLEPMCEFGHGPQGELDQKALEQTGGDVPVGFVVVLAALVDFFDFARFCLEQNGLDVVLDEVGIEVAPAIVDGVGGEIGQLEKRFEHKKAGFDAPSFVVYLYNDLFYIFFIKLFFVKN